jgi:hypothetical protein
MLALMAARRKEARMSAFVIGIPVPEGLDSKTYRVRVVVDRIDGIELTPEDLQRIEAVYPSKPAKPTAKRRAKTATPAARKARTTRKSNQAA